MKKFSSAVAAAAVSAGMIAGAGIAIAQIPEAAPSSCPNGQHFEARNGKVECVNDPNTTSATINKVTPQTPADVTTEPGKATISNPDAAPKPESPKPAVPGECDGYWDMSQQAQSGVWGVCVPNKPAPKPEESTPSEDKSEGRTPLPGRNSA